MRVEILENGNDRIILHMEPETKKDISKLDEILNLGGQSVQGFGLDPQTRDIDHMQIIVQKNFDRERAE